MNEPNILDTDASLDIQSLSFEDALSHLEKIVTALEQGDVPLAKALDIYEKGEHLKRHCETLLKTAENKIEQIRLSQNKEEVETIPFTE